MSKGGRELNVNFSNRNFGLRSRPALTLTSGSDSTYAPEDSSHYTEMGPPAMYEFHEQPEETLNQAVVIPEDVAEEDPTPTKKDNTPWIVGGIAGVIAIGAIVYVYRSK